MMMKTVKSIMYALMGLMVMTQGISIAGETYPDTGLGEKLVRQFWTDMKTENIKALEAMMAPGFQSIHADGARNRQEEIELIKGLHMKPYVLDNFRETHAGPVMIVTYTVSVSETIAGKNLAAKPSPRLTAWLKTDHGWQIIVHANPRCLH